MKGLYECFINNLIELITEKGEFHINNSNNSLWINTSDNGDGEDIEVTVIKSDGVIAGSDDDFIPWNELDVEEVYSIDNFYREYFCHEGYPEVGDLVHWFDPAIDEYGADKDKALRRIFVVDSIEVDDEDYEDSVVWIRQIDEQVANTQVYMSELEYVDISEKLFDYFVPSFGNPVKVPTDVELSDLLQFTVKQYDDKIDDGIDEGHYIMCRCFNVVVSNAGFETIKIYYDSYNDEVTDVEVY